jgi:hypothetical protein
MRALLPKRNSRARVLFCLAFLLAIPSPAADESSARQPAAPKFDHIRIDALDAEAWNGVVFAANAFGQPSSFALRFGSYSSTFIDGASIFDAIHEVGPHAPDGSYCRIPGRFSLGRQ